MDDDSIYTSEPEIRLELVFFQRVYCLSDNLFKCVLRKGTNTFKPREIDSVEYTTKRGENKETKVNKVLNLSDTTKQAILSMKEGEKAVFKDSLKGETNKFTLNLLEIKREMVRINCKKFSYSEKTLTEGISETFPSKIGKIYFTVRTENCSNMLEDKEIADIKAKYLENGMFLDEKLNLVEVDPICSVVPGSFLNCLQRTNILEKKRVRLENQFQFKNLEFPKEFEFQIIFAEEVNSLFNCYESDFALKQLEEYKKQASLLFKAGNIRKSKQIFKFIVSEIDQFDSLVKMPVQAKELRQNCTSNLVICLHKLNKLNKTVKKALEVVL